MIRALLALVVAMWPWLAVADDGRDDAAFREATRRAIAGDPGAQGAFEALGARQPPTRWTDDAWSEAARLAERAGDLPRARRAYAQVVSIDRDAALVARARAALARLGDTSWDTVTVEHERLVEATNAGGDPAAALGALAALLAAHPAYPRATAIRLALALGWEREGETARALGWYADAVAHACGETAMRASLAHARAAIRADELAVARTILDAPAPRRCDGAPAVALDRAAIADIRDALVTAEHRQTLRRVLAGLLVLVAGVALALVRRDTGSWRGLARVPVEVRFLVPIAIVLVGVARTGNPRVGDAVTLVAVAGVAIAYGSGVVLDAARLAGRLHRRRLVAHVAIVVATVMLAAYLAVDRYRVIDLLRETAAHGFAR